ncbi:hypothetical protein ACFY2T_36615 [Streptomyces sp. NPDC001260]|uniref:hypothetical protein n=1 Tax=Streptomyces sp. NPDC001260 TaxID=3364551 RepID=UPI0036A64EED
MPDDAAASEDTEYETTGSGEQPETRSGLCRVPDTMTSVPAVLLAGSLAVGVAPGFAGVVAHAVDEAGAGGAVVSAPHRTPAGVFLSLASPRRPQASRPSPWPGQGCSPVSTAPRGRGACSRAPR